jgi:deoxyribose-phosphate aldolase
MNQRPEELGLERLVALAAVRLAPAGKRETRPAAGLAPDALAQAIDHTLLKPTATAAQIDALCGEALEFGFATVCVNPVWVERCAHLLGGSPVKVCTVIGFPLGTTTTEAKVFEAQSCAARGAAELDMVVQIGPLLAGDYAVVGEDIAAVVSAAHAQGAAVKVIIEAAYLGEREKIAACILSKAAGADFVKTSTGFGPGGATVEDVALMRHVVGTEMGVKAAGGIRTADDAYKMLAAGASRLGASASVSIMHEATAGPRPA